MSKETRKDFVLLAITSIAAAIGMISVFSASRPLAWIAIGISDAYLALVLLFAAILSDDGTVARRRAWIAGLFPKRTTALFVVTLLLLSIVSGFAGLYVGTEVFPSSKTPRDALYISLFTLAFTDYGPKPGYGQFVVVGEVASGILFLIAAVPLLISRIATFDSPRTLLRDSMKTKEIIKVARRGAKPFRVSKGKDFRLKDVDPNNTREFTKEADKARAKQALANGVTAEVHGQP